MAEGTSDLSLPLAAITAVSILLAALAIPGGGIRNPVDEVKVQLYGVDDALWSADAAWRSGIELAWGAAYSQVLRALRDINGTSLANPSSAWARISELESWRSSRAWSGEDSSVVVNSSLERAAGPVDLSPAQVVWLGPGAQVSPSPWEWACRLRWTVLVRSPAAPDSTARTSTGSAVVPVPLRPADSLAAALEVYEYLLDARPESYELEPITSWLDSWPPDLASLMESARDLAELAMYGNEEIGLKGIAYFADRGFRASARRAFDSAVKVRLTWSASAGEPSSAVEARVVGVRDEGGVYEAEAEAEVVLCVPFELRGSATVVRLLQVGCSDCDSFYLPSNGSRFSRAHMVYRTDDKPSLVREREVTLCARWTLRARARASSPEDAERAALAEVEERAADFISERLGELAEALANLEGGLEFIVYPDDFDWECGG